MAAGASRIVGISFGGARVSLKNPNIVSAARRKRVAIVIANPAVSTTTGWPVGFWRSELTHPYHAFHEAGYETEVFSPVGGRCDADAMSDPSDASDHGNRIVATAQPQRPHGVGGDHRSQGLTPGA